MIDKVNIVTQKFFKISRIVISCTSYNINWDPIQLGV